MSFSAWSDKKKNKETGQVQTPSSKNEVKVSTFSDWSDRKRDGSSAQQWLASSNDLLNDMNRFYSGWQNNATQNHNYQKRASNLIAVADIWRNQYRDDTEAVSQIDAVVSALTSAKRSAQGMFDYYSQWDSEDSYNAALKQAELDAQRWSELTGGYDPTKNLQEGQAGWAAWLEQQKRHAEYAQAAKNAKEEAPWWETVLGYIGDIGPDTSLPFHVDTAEVAEGYQKQEDAKKVPYDSWTDEQKYIYGYLWNQSRSKAAEYAYAVNNMQSIQQEQERMKQIQERATGNFGAGAAHTAGAILSAPLGLADYLGDVIAHGALGYVPEADGQITPFEYSQAVTGGVSAHLNDFGTLNDDIPVIGGKGWGDVYGLGTSIAQSALAAYAGSQGQALIQFFGSSAAASVDDAVSRGADGEQAILYGTMQGLAEGLAEMVGVDNLMKIGSASTVRQLVGNLLKQGAAEGIEEGITAVLNNFADNLVMGDKSNFNALVQQYMNQGMSADEAKRKAWMDSAEEIAFDMLGGFVSGSVHAGPQTAYQTYQSNMEAKQIYGGSQQELVSEALEIDPENAFAKKMQGRIDSGKNLSGGQLHRLVQQSEATLTAQDMSAIQSAAVQRLSELGETGDVQTIGAALAKQAAGEKLSRAERQAITNSKYGQRVANELNTENINSGDYSSAWAENIGTNRINVDEYSRIVEAAQLPQETAETTGEQVAAQAPKTVQAAQIEPVGPETASENDQQMTSKLTGKESLQVAEEPAVSDDGVTRQNSTGKEVTPKKIASISGGKVMIETSDGTISADDISFGSKDTDLLWRGAVDFNGINASGANGVIHAYRSGQPVSTYLQGAAQEFRNGYYNMESGGEYADKLTPWQREIIYDLGQKAAGEHIDKEQSAAKNATTTKASDKDTNVPGKTKKIGKVHFDRNGRTFDAKRETALKTMEQLSKALGVEFYVYESYVNESGQRVYKDASGNEVHAPNGFYDPKDGSIHIDLNAGADGKGTMLFTIAHELTHFIRQWSPAKFKVLANFLIKQYGQKGVSVDELVQRQIAKAEKNGRTIDYDTAFEEVVADSMEAIMTDGNVVQMMAELKQQDKALWQKICDWFKDLVADLKALVDTYKDVKPDTYEGKMVAQMQDVIVMLEYFYTDALVDASENYQASDGTQKNTPQKGGEKYSFAGQNSENADHGTLDRAKEMLDQGMSNEAIRQETGWFRGMDGKWRYEIDDSKMEIAENLSNYMRLGDMMQHEGLYAAYPDLADINVVFQGLETGVNGSYNPQFDSINLNYKLKNDPFGLKDALAHEVQHAIQNREGFTKGATVESWERKKRQGFDSRRAEDRRKAQETERELRRLQEEEPEFYRDMLELEAMTPNVPRGEIDWDTLEKIEDDPVEWQQYDARREELEAKYGDIKVWDANDLLYQRTRAAQNMGRSGTELYFDTAGEIEARDTANRRTKTQEQRKTTPPRLGNEDTVFAEGAGQSDQAIGKTINNKPFVIVENDILDGVVPSDWVRIVTQNIRSKFPNGVTIGKNNIAINQKSRRELTYSEYMHRIKRDDPQLYSDKLRATDNLDEIIQATTDWINEGLKHERSDNIQDFARGTVLIRIGSNDYSAEVVVGTKTNGTILLYDIMHLKKTSISDKKTDASVTSESRNDSTDRQLASQEEAPLITGTQNVGEAGGATSTVSINRRTLDVKRKNVKEKFSLREDSTYAEIEEEKQKLYQQEIRLAERKRIAQNDPVLLQAMDEISDMFTEMRDLLPKRHNGTATQAELDRIEELKTLRDERIQLAAKLQESLGLNAISQEETEIREKKEALRIASDAAWAREGAEKENKAIEKAGVPAAEYFRKKALKAFKTTNNFNEAGYLLPDGKLLNFSGGERNHRYRDHREIGEIYEATQGAAALNRFLNDGNIRIMAESPGADLASGVEPTKEQYDALRRFINASGSKDGRFFVDFSDTDGHRAGNYSYEGRVNAERVINDIKYYYATGNIREQSSISQFLYSERDPELERVNRVLTKENAELKYDIAYLKELLKLQKQATGGTKFTRTSVEATAGQLMKYANARGEKTELAGLLNGVYEYIAKGEELTWDGVKEAAQPVVAWLQNHVRAEKKVNSYAQDILREIRGSKIYLDETQKKEVAYQYGSYNDFRKRMFGSVVITDNDGISLDSQWHEWAGMYPNIFDPEVTTNDMPSALLDAIDTLRNMTDMDSYGYDDELVSQDLLRQVYDSYWNVSTLYTVADKAQKEIDQLKFDHSKRMTALRKFHNEKTAQLKREHREDIQRVRQESKERTEKKLRELSDRYQESKKKGAENRRKTEMRQKIRRTVMDLNKLLNRGDKKRNVKEDMQDLVSKALTAADILFTDEYSSEDMVRNGVGTELTEQEAKHMAEARDIMDQIGKLPSGSFEAFQERQEAEAKLKSKLAYRLSKLQDVFTRERARLNKTKVSEVLGDLADAYASLENSEYSYVNGAFHDNVHQYLVNLRTEVGGTTVKDMSLNQLEELHKAYTMVVTTVRNANRMFAANLKQTRDQLGSHTIAEIQKAGGEHGLWLPGADKLNSFSWNNEKPIYAFERIGSDTLTKLFENTRAGEDTWAKDMDDARKYYVEQKRKHKYDSWDFAKQYKFTSTSGIDFSLNLEQIMSLYAYSKREQAHDHLMKGGFVFDGNTEVQVNKMGIKMTYLNKSAKAHNVSPEILGEITSKLTPEQRQFVDEMQDYLSTTMGGKGNEVSMQMYGVELFKEKHYFPLRSAGQYMERAKDADLKKQQGQISIVNSGFTKSTKPKSGNPVVLSGFTDVWASHVNEMSMYHSFVLPMEDFRRVYNYASPNMETGESVSVNSVIQEAYGKAATDYIDQLYRDLNGGAISDPRDTLIKTLMSRFKKAAVFASLSVVIQQPSAICRAFALIDPKYFIGGKVNSKRHKAQWAELKRYAPVAAIKEMGYFDTGMGRSAKDFLLGKEYNTLKEKAAALFTDENYRDELLSKGPALADELTWCAIWEAAKRETKAKHKGMSVTSEEFLQLAGKRFTEVITKTQVYDSVLSRSANMRSKGLMTMWTAFMAEPTTTINMVEDALRKGKRGNKKYAARVIGAVFISVVLNAMLVSLVRAMRDDDEDETFLEKYTQSFATEILDGINPLTYYPFLKDVWSALQGFDIERSDMSLITSLTEAITKLVQVYSKDADNMDEEQLDAYYKRLGDAWWGVVDYVTALVGLPVKNVRRDINGAINMVKTIGEDLNGRNTSWGSLIDKTWDDVKNAIPVVGWLPDKTAADKLYKATVSGDKAYQKRLASSYSTESSLNSAIKKGLRENDSRIWEAAIAWNDNELEEYMRIAKEIVGEGNFSQDHVVLAIQSEAKSMLDTKNENTSSTIKAKGYFTVEKFAVAIAQGNASMAAAVKDDIIETSLLNGKTYDEAEDSFISSAKTKLKETYLDGGITALQTIDALAEYCGVEEEDAQADVLYWDFKKKYPDIFVDDTWIDEYYEEVADSGIAIDVFVNYRNEVKGITGQNKKEDRMAVINSMSISDAQKDALYYAEGWAESRIYEAPWH